MYDRKCLAQWPQNYSVVTKTPMWLAIALANSAKGIWNLQPGVIKFRKLPFSGSYATIWLPQAAFTAYGCDI